MVNTLSKFIVLTSEEKSKFRASKTWKDFRTSLLRERGSHCTCCGTKYSGKRSRMLQLHHLNPKDYMDLDKDAFVLLCTSCHKTVELLERKLHAKNPTILNEDKWIALYGPYLPHLYKKKKDTN